MDPNIRKYLESMNAQIEENGRMIKTIRQPPLSHRPNLIKPTIEHTSPGSIIIDESLSSFTLDTVQ